MKQLLTLVLILIHLTPATAQLMGNNTFTLTNQRSLDGKQYNLVAGKSVPYATGAEFLLTVPATRRHIGQIAYVTKGTGVVVWQFTGGIADVNFKEIANAAPDSTRFKSTYSARLDSQALANSIIANKGWGKQGNAGTNPSLDFIGTIDAQDLVIRTGGVVVGRYKTGTNAYQGIGSVATGSGSFSVATGIATGMYSSAFGAGQASGYNSLASNEAFATAYASFATTRSRAEAPYANSAGVGSIARGFSATVVGMYNDISTTQSTDPSLTNRMFDVGVGTGEGARKSAMVVLGNGNVGIGTVTPGSILHVVGSLKLVTGQQHAGYVLTSDAAGEAEWKVPALSKVTKAQRDAIVAPTAGLMVYQTDFTPGLRTYNGTSWMKVTETAD